MHIHILGICGTFMAGIALLAREKGYQVTGSDQNVYPPMSTQLADAGITIYSDYAAEHLKSEPDCVVIGNAMSRGNPAVEYVLSQQLPYISGPQWLAECLLNKRWVLAVTGTHGKTTTSSMLAWILEFAGYNPGFLIGGVPQNFCQSARLGSEPFFVIEADEYDSAFFDKRPKFIHYHPRTLILNNLEYDHADIYPNLAAIKQQFHYLMRTVPGNGLIVRNTEDPHLADVMDQGYWTPEVPIALQGDGGGWSAMDIAPDGSAFIVCWQGQQMGMVEWDLLGIHNVYNALAAIAAANHAGVEPEVATASLSEFKNVKRRLEVRARVNDITLYDDFAHHPTAIATTVAGLRQRVGQSNVIAILELGSYTMRTGIHRDRIADALAAADQVYLLQPGWIDAAVVQQFKQPIFVSDSVDDIVRQVVNTVQPGDHLLVMSNKGFDGIHDKIIQQL